MLLSGFSVEVLMSNQHGARLEAVDRSEEMALCPSLGREKARNPHQDCVQAVHSLTLT